MKQLLLSLFLLVIYSFTDAQTVTDWTKTDIKGKDHTLFSILAAHNAVILAFISVGDNASKTSLGSLQSIWADYDTGTNQVMVFAMNIVPTEPDSLLEQFLTDNGAAFPGFSDCHSDFLHYNAGSTQYPLFVLIIPNSTTPANSFVEYTSKGTWTTSIADSLRENLNKNGFHKTGSDELSNNFEVALFPNPATLYTDITLKLRSTQYAEIELYNILGKRVAEPFAGIVKSGDKRKIHLNLTALPRGFYFARIRVGDEITTLKLNVTN